MSETTDSQSVSQAPPYTSFTTLIRAIERMAEEGGAPSRLDRSYLSNLPGGAQTIFLASCKSLGLISEDLKPTARLEDLVSRTDAGRKEAIRELITDYYAGPLSLGQRATQAQLEEEFRKLNVSGSTLRKAVGFFLGAARYAEIDYSPNFKLPKASPAGTRKRKANSGPGGEPDPDPPPKLPTHKLPTLVQGLVERLPEDGTDWTEQESNDWLALAKLTFPFVYGFKATEGGQSD